MFIAAGSCKGKTAPRAVEPAMPQPLPAALVVRGTSGIFRREGCRRPHDVLRAFWGFGAPADVDEAPSAPRGIPIGHEHCQIGKGPSSQFERDSDAALFSQPRRLRA